MAGMERQGAEEREESQKASPQQTHAMSFKGCPSLVSIARRKFTIKNNPEKERVYFADIPPSP